MCNAAIKEQQITQADWFLATAQNGSRMTRPEITQIVGGIGVIASLVYVATRHDLEGLLGRNFFEIAKKVWKS